MMKKKTSTCTHFFGESFRTAQRTEGKRGGGARISICHNSFFSSRPLLEGHNAQEERMALVFAFFSGAPDRTQKKLNMIAKEFEFVVGRMH